MNTLTDAICYRPSSEWHFGFPFERFTTQGDAISSTTTRYNHFLPSSPAYQYTECRKAALLKCCFDWVELSIISDGLPLFLRCAWEENISFPSKILTENQRKREKPEARCHPKPKPSRFFKRKKGIFHNVLFETKRGKKMCTTKRKKKTGLSEF